ncbi:hypothetical protein K445DRAFT_110803 [Daldinia sp. EC12]|nr:hypothetical protein K445DRAFT_110803 [Daldinia sp. EC12]
MLNFSALQSRNGSDGALARWHPPRFCLQLSTSLLLCRLPASEWHSTRSHETGARHHRHHLHCSLSQKRRPFPSIAYFQASVKE